MKRINKDRIVNICLLVIGLAGLTFSIITNKNDNKLNSEYQGNEKVHKEQFAMYIEDDAGNYVEYESNSFPNGYVLNTDNSQCIDINNNLVDGALSNVDNSVTVTTNKTVFCYLYFDIPPVPLTDYLMDTETRPSSLWTSTLDSDGYRFVGTDPSNYICFGTNDKDTCVGNTDLYMYRIIGIFQESEGNNHLKLIKKEALNETYYWTSELQESINWGDSTLYQGLNGNYYLSNATYSYMQDTKWTDKITDWTWSAANTLSHSYDDAFGYGGTAEASEIYYHEMNHANKSYTIGSWTTPNGKIGLLYASDYILSLGANSLNYTSWSNSSTLKTGWMHIENNDTAALSTTGSAAPSLSEYTTSRVGAYSGSTYVFQVWVVDDDGSVTNVHVHNSYSSRPVFYLEPSVGYESGTGTSTDPYIISKKIIMRK